MAIPGEAEADWIFTAGLTSITTVRCPKYTLPSPSPFSRVKKIKGHHHELFHYYSLIHKFISRPHEMKWRSGADT
jgi:hypothetical protein